jgi:hypothetical protein
MYYRDRHHIHIILGWASVISHHQPLLVLSHLESRGGEGACFDLILTLGLQFGKDSGGLFIIIHNGLDFRWETALPVPVLVVPFHNCPNNGIEETQAQGSRDFFVGSSSLSPSLHYTAQHQPQPVQLNEIEREKGMILILIMHEGFLNAEGLLHILILTFRIVNIWRYLYSQIPLI